MSTIKLVTDTTTGLPLAEMKALGIQVLPQIIIFGEDTFRDDTELDTQTFLDKLRAAPELPKTSAPPPHLFAPVYGGLATEGHTIISLHPSDELSGTVKFAQVARQDLPEADIRVIDSRSVAAPLGMMVLKADEWIKEGADADTVVSRVQDMIERQRLYFLVDTLEFLHKGGRIGGAQALVGGLLQIKPILAIQDGRVEPLEQQRTKKKALARLKELVAQDCPRSKDAHLCVMHADAEQTAAELARDLAVAMGLDEVPVYEMPPAIVVHAGPGVLGAGFFVES
jgi:DegV family protein with EDD domain